MRTTAVRNKRIPSLDGIRAISFFVVFISHLGFMGGRPGSFGVSVFFVLSGYLITTLLIREFAQTKTISLKMFYLRRTARIFPPMYLILAACIGLALAHILEGHLTWLGTGLGLAYLQNYGYWYGELTGRSVIVPGTAAFWSLCVEEHFYLLYPFVFLLMLRNGFSFSRITKILFGFCVFELVWRMVAVRLIPMGYQWCAQSTDTRLDSIMWGCLLANLEQVPQWRAFLKGDVWLRVLVAVGLLMLTFTFLFHDVGRATLRYTLQGAGLVPLLYFAINTPNSYIIRPLNHPILIHLGVLSYVLYLVHGPIILIWENDFHFRGLQLWITCALCTYLTALLIHLLVERPMELVRARLRR